MKKNTKIGFYLAIAGVIMLASACSSTRNSTGKNPPDISTLVQSHDFIFKARRAIAQNGYTKNLLSDYSLSVSTDTLIAFLPYYGRAYRAPMDPTKGGIQFTSTDFSYNLAEEKEGAWTITIIPLDHKNEVDKMTLRITSSGHAILHVLSTHRQSITFNGNVEERN